MILQNIFFGATSQKRKQSNGLLSFLERCVPHAERDAHFVRDDGFTL